MCHPFLEAVQTYVKTTIIGGLIGCLALACAGTATASGRCLEIAYRPSGKQEELQLGVTYTLWIPDGVTKIRGVIVHQHGCGSGACKGGATAAYDLHWQALAKKWDCTLLGPSYHQNDKQNCWLWCDPHNGSHKTYLKALGEFAAQAKNIAAKAKAKELDVLFIGNSQIYFNDLPRIVEALAESAANDQPRIRAERFVAGGASLERLWNAGEGKGTARAKILEKKWDFVIVHEIFNVTSEGFTKFAPLFHDLIQKNGAQTVLFCTASVSTMYPKGFHELHDLHIAMGKKLQAPVTAGGKAWLSYWGDMPTAEERLALYDPDKAHPGKKGSYLYACTLYAVLTGHSPVGLTNRIPKQPADAVTEKEARHFQEAAWRVHQAVNPNKKDPPAKLERMTKIRADLKSTHVEVRRAAIRALVHSDISELLREDMQAALADSDAEMRATAATAIGNLGGAAVPALPALIGQMQKDPSKEARETAARALGRIGKAAPKERQAVPPLRQAAARDADPVTRVVALGALAMMEVDIPEQVAALRKYLPHDSSLVRMKAAHALGMIGPAAKTAAPEIVTVLERATDPHERAYIARALGNTGDPASLPAIYKAIERETDAGARGEMRGAISRLGGKAPAN
jgi:HEAT repeat protein